MGTLIYFLPCSQSLRAEYLRLTETAITAGQTGAEADMLRWQYFEKKIQNNPSENHLLFAAGFMPKWKGRYSEKPTDWSAYKNLVMVNTR